MVSHSSRTVSKVDAESDCHPDEKSGPVLREHTGPDKDRRVIVYCSGRGNAGILTQVPALNEGGTSIKPGGILKI